MVRKSFKLFAALVGLSALVGTFAPVQAKAEPTTDTSKQVFDNAYLYDTTWAGANDTLSMTAYGYGMNWSGYIAGSFSVATETWVSNGAVLNASCYQDAQGEHTDIFQYVVFSHISNGAIADYIPALETFHVLKQADGSLSEAAEVTDFQGNPLADTGKDANDALQMLPILRGGIFTMH